MLKRILCYGIVLLSIFLGWYLDVNRIIINGAFYWFLGASAVLLCDIVIEN